MSPQPKELHAREERRAPKFRANAVIEGMRPQQWVKNGFVLLPLVFAGKLLSPGVVISGLAAVAAFSLTASGVYLLNDVADWPADLSHPAKRSRPIPSGRLSTGAAAAWGLALLLAGMALGFAIGRSTGFLIAAYVLVQILYTQYIKHMMILDLMCISTGFVMRVLAGSTAVQVKPSHWLLICTFLLSLFLGVGKRRQETERLGRDSPRSRPVLVAYNLPWLDQVATALSGATVLAYALYTVAPETEARFGSDRLMYTLPFVVYGILRYLHLMRSGDRAGNPAEALLRDWPLICCVSAWAVTCAAIIYL